MHSDVHDQAIATHSFQGKMTLCCLKVWEGPHQRAGLLCWWSLTFLWYKSLTLGQVLDYPISE